MKPKNRIMMFVFMLSLALGEITAQSTVNRETLDALQTLSDRYRKQEFLSFNIQYKYTSETQPEVYLDSIQGSIKMNGTHYWCRLDSTEFIVNSQFAIALFKEDKIMYITKPTPTSISMNPIALLDSILNQNPGIQSQVSQSNKQKRISLIFPQNQKYRQMDYIVNLNTGLLDQVITIVHASQLYDQETRKLLDQESTYVKIEARFSHYQTEGFNKNCFESTYYFQQNGNNSFNTTPTFSQYQIFIGSSDIQ